MRMFLGHFVAHFFFVFIIQKKAILLLKRLSAYYLFRNIRIKVKIKIATILGAKPYKNLCAYLFYGVSGDSFCMFHSTVAIVIVANCFVFGKCTPPMPPSIVFTVIGNNTRIKKTYNASERNDKKNTILVKETDGNSIEKKLLCVSKFHKKNGKKRRKKKLNERKSSRRINSAIHTD